MSAWGNAITAAVKNLKGEDEQAADAAMRLAMMQRWMREGRIFVDPPLLVSDRTKLEMRRGAERTGSPDPFDPAGTTTVTIGAEVLIEPTGVFPSEVMVARIALALYARQDEVDPDEGKSDTWPGWKDN